MKPICKQIGRAMNIIGIIPARYQSTRFPGKPLADIAGKPMIQHVYERALKAQRLERVLVATDDVRILDRVRAFGGKALLTSPEHPSGTDRLAEACRLLGLQEDDLVVNIQGDEPLLEPVMIDLLVEALEQAPKVPMATLASVSHSAAAFSDPNVVKVVVNSRMQALYFSRAAIPCRRDANGSPQEFLHHLGFYAYRQAFLQEFTRLPPGRLEQVEQLEQLRALEHGYPIQVALSPFETQGVDTPDDLKKVLTHLGKAAVR
jgi:3-deoxy-manno-octulosonate cytidylyltransferase (CMP-KDO synthetase)